MHGQLDRALCAACGHRWDAPTEMTKHDPCPACGSAASRPYIVWFDEVPYHMERICDGLRRAEVFAAIGTSGNVYPAAGFARHAARQGADCVVLNLMNSVHSRDFHRHMTGPATEIVPAWVDGLG